MDTVQCTSCGEDVGAQSAVCPQCGSDPRSARPQQFAPIGAPPAPQVASPPYVPRHTVRRGIASLIDWAIFGVVAILIWTATLNTPDSAYSSGTSVGRFLLLPAIVAGVLFVYGSALESVRGATLGKLLVGARARMLDGRRCSAGSAALRNVSKAVVGAATVMFAMGVAGLVVLLRSPGSEIYWSRLTALLLAGPACLVITFAFMMTSPLRQRLGDRLAGTVVVRRRATYPAPVEVVMPVSLPPTG
jgi:uncharacterized RDD family membrane protein YckC